MHNSKTKSQKLSVLAYLLLFVTISLSFYIWLSYFSEQYIFFAILIILEVILFSMIRLEFKDISAKEIALMASLATLSVVSRIMFFAIPQVKPTAAVVFIAGLSLGPGPGFIIGLLSMFLSNFVFGQTLNTPFQMLGMGLVGFIAGLFALRNLKHEFSLWLQAILAFLLVLIVYGLTVDFGTIIFAYKAQGELAIYTTLALGFPFNMAHAVASFIFVLFLSPLLSKQVSHICNKYGLFLVKMLK